MDIHINGEKQPYAATCSFYTPHISRSISFSLSLSLFLCMWGCEYISFGIQQVRAIPVRIGQPNQYKWAGMLDPSSQI